MTSQMMSVVVNDTAMVRVECRMGWVLLEYRTNDAPLAITRLVRFTLLLGNVSWPNHHGEQERKLIQSGLLILHLCIWHVFVLLQLVTL